jgi:hypothetical protein
MSNATKKPAEPTTVKVVDPTKAPTGKLQHIGGSKNDDWNNILANQTLSTLWLASKDEARSRQYSAALAALIGIAPQGEIEGMIAAQLVACHNASTECYRRAMIGEQTFEGRRENLSQANKATLLESLNRHRGKGAQKVTVEHVHVHDGGQAIVGNVEAPGGGLAVKAGDQPHALGYAPSAPLPSADAARESLPVTRDEERTMPDARRTFPGRSKG